MSINFVSLMSALFIGGAAGYLGSLMATKKMSLAGDVLSHVALPGIGFALLLGLNISLGALASLIIGVFIIWLLGMKTSLSSELLTGVVFVISLAIGFIVVPDHELLEALFGDITSVNYADMAMVILISIIVFLVARNIYPKMMLAYISEDMALAEGVKINKNNLIYLLIVAVVIAFGVKIAGSLLTSALIILPAAAAKNISGSMKQYSFLAALLGVVGAGGGVALAGIIGISAGPVVAILSAIIFGFTLAFGKIMR